MSDPTFATTHGNPAFLPGAVHDLIVKPVTEESLALRVSHVVHTGDDVSHYRVPIVTADPSAAWVWEGDEIPVSRPTLDEVSSGFRKVAGLTIISRELAEDSSPDAAALVGRGLARDIARKVDAAYFGTNLTEAPDTRNEAQPRGLSDLTGINTVDAGTAWTNVDPFSEAVYAAEGVGATVGAFIAHPDDALALAQVKKATGSNEPLLGNDPTQPTRRVLAGVPLHISPAVTAGSIWGIPTGLTIVAIRSDSTVTADHSVFFTSDRVAVKATMRLAVLFPHPTAVQKINLTA